MKSTKKKKKNSKTGFSNLAGQKKVPFNSNPIEIFIFL